MELKKQLGSLGVKHWGDDWATCWGFLRENDLDEPENWLYMTTKDDRGGDNRAVDALYMLARFSLYLMPPDWYAKRYADYTCDPYAGMCETDALARLWFRLTHTADEVAALEAFSFRRATRESSRQSYELSQMKIGAAVPYATSENGTRLRLLEETGCGYATDEAYRELCFRNYAARAVSAGLLYSLDALADGVPACYL